MLKPEFDAMVAPARLYPQIWRLILGILVVIFVYLGFNAILIVGLYAFRGAYEFGIFITRVMPPDDPLAATAMLLTTWGFVLGALIAVPACHMRGPGTIFGPAGETVRTFFLAVVVCLPLYALVTVASSAFEPPVPNLPLETWLPWALAAIPVILLQSAGEEMIFRGYLPQQLAARFRSRIVWMGIPAILFGFAHWNEAAGQLKYLIIFTTFVLGILAMDLTERTGSIGAAIGLHFVNNLFGVLIVAMKGTITGLALWVSPTGFEAQGTAGIGLALNLAFLFVVWLAVRWAVDR